MKNNVKRPLSPHLSIYKLQISSLTSIMHRLSGLFVFAFLLVVFWWAAFFLGTKRNVGLEESYSILSCQCNFKYFIIAAYLCFVFASCYHFFNGIRHLCWDVGAGFEIKTMNFTGKLVMLMSFAAFFALTSMLFA